VAFTWWDYWKLAEKLKDGLPAQFSQYTDSDIAAMRCAISRAYYAAYWHSRTYLENKFPSFQAKSESHLSIVRKMKESHGELSSIGRQLDTLRVRRTQADYDLNARYNKRDVELGLSVAKQIIDRIDALP
jgi:uncharacterized protein (UPF0332 family)